MTFKITNRSKFNKSYLKFKGNFKSHIIFRMTEKDSKKIYSITHLDDYSLKVEGIV
jgi:hypothetical protein